MKKIIFLLYILCSLSVSAQMVDLMGGLAVQGAIAGQSTQSAIQGLSAAQRLKVLQDIQDIVMQVKTNYFGTYTFINKNIIQGNPLNGMNWIIGSVSDDLFYIQLNQIDNQTCRYLITQNVSAKDTLLNNKKANSSLCSDQNIIRFIFD